MKKNNPMKYLFASLIFILAFFMSTEMASADYWLNVTVFEDYNVVDLPPVPPISVNLTANPYTMTLPENQTTLTWTTSGSPDSCQASNYWGGGKNPGGGTETINDLNFAQGYLFEIKCVKAGTADAYGSAMVIVNEGSNAPTVMLSASPNPVNAGMSSDITWTVTNNPTECTAIQGTPSWTSPASKDPAGGSEPSGPIYGMTTFRMSCSNASGFDTDSVTVTLVSAPVDPDKFPTVILSASPTLIGSGESSNITWDPNNADTCTASGGTSAWNNPPLKNKNGGMMPSGPIGVTTLFSITCSNSYGSASSNATVTVKGDQCLAPMVIVNGQCVDSCPIGQFPNAQRVCVKPGYKEI